MSGIDVGDLVVCISNPTGSDEEHTLWVEGEFIRVGASYRVLEACEFWDGGLGLLFEGDPGNVDDDSAWDIVHFRKIESADEQFTEQIRACRPIRQREPA